MRWRADSEMDTLDVRVVHFAAAWASGGAEYFERVDAGDAASLESGYIQVFDQENTTMRLYAARLLQALRHVLRNGDGAEGLTASVVEFNTYFPLACIRETCGAFAIAPTNLWLDFVALDARARGLPRAPLLYVTRVPNCRVAVRAQAPTPRRLSATPPCSSGGASCWSGLSS